MGEGLKNPLPPGEIFFTCHVVSFRTRPALSLPTKTTFVTERISSMRHMLPHPAGCAMLRACIFLRRHHTFPRQRLSWRLRSSHTEHKPNLPNQTYQTKPTKSNLPNQ